VGIDTHWEELGIFTFLNHSCDPTVIVDTTRFKIYAARALAAKEELTFFYPSLDWLWVNRSIDLPIGVSALQTVKYQQYLTNLVRLLPWRAYDVFSDRFLRRISWTM
jgi:hypothetical protein